MHTELLVLALWSSGIPDGALLSVSTGDFGLYFQLKIKKLKEQYQEGIDNDLIT